MFEIGWTEMLVIAVVMIVVVGPKDLPKMLRTIGRMTGKMRSMAGDFRKQFDDALKEAELDDLKKTIDTARSYNPASQIKSALNPMEQAAKDVRAGLDLMMKPKPVDLPKATDGLQPADAPTPNLAGTPAAPGATEAAPTVAATAAPTVAAPVVAAAAVPKFAKAAAKPAKPDVVEPVVAKPAAAKPAATKTAKPAAPKKPAKAST